MNQIQDDDTYFNQWNRKGDRGGWDVKIFSSSTKRDSKWIKEKTMLILW